MIPPFLSDYKAEIEKYKLETVKIFATPVSKNDTLPITQSRFLGVPYLPSGISYPVDKKGVPMILWAQINFAEVPHLQNYPQWGIFQLFVSSTDWYDMEDYKILFHEDITQDAQENFDFLTENLYNESPIHCEHKLKFEKAFEYGGVTDYRFDLEFDGEDYYEYYETLSKEQQKEMDALFDATGHKIGGYAYFTQEDIRDYDITKDNDILILQIDTDEKIMFGDSGVANIFIKPDDLANKRFEKAYFNWDCC
jgi:uncharacterized protein YwqG